MGKDFVGFGTIQVASTYSRYTGGLPHCYIPLLALKPGFKSYGYGQAMVEHLVAEAAVHVPLWPGKISDRLFLDVYTANDKARKLYQDKCQFVTLNPDAPILDPDQNNEPYVVMAQSVKLPAPP